MTVVSATMCYRQRRTSNIMEAESRARTEVADCHQCCAGEPMQADDRPPSVPIHDNLRRTDPESRAVTALCRTGWRNGRRLLCPASQPHHAPQEPIINSTHRTAPLQTSAS